MMYEPKKDLYELLEEIVYTDLVVLQNRPEIIKTLPCITFRIDRNGANYNLNVENVYQDIVAVVDIWAKTSKSSGEILSLLESKLSENGWLLEFAQDLEDPDGISHITTRFNFIK